MRLHAYLDDAGQANWNGSPMTDHRTVFPPVDLKMNWFQEPLRDHTDLDDKVSFALPVQSGLCGIIRTESTLVRE
jgi:hypothetical protein